MARLKVQAIADGFYIGFRKIGDVFDIEDVLADKDIPARKAAGAETLFSTVWMKTVDSVGAKRVEKELARRAKVAADIKRVAAAEKGIMADAQSVSSEIERMRAEIDSLRAANEEQAANTGVLEAERDEAREEAERLGAATDTPAGGGDGGDPPDTPVVSD